MRKLLVIVSLVTLTGIAGADDKKPPAADKGNGKVKVYDFTADSIEGELVKPEGVGVTVGSFGKAASLIRIRKDFIPEITKSAEDIQ